MKKFRAKSDEGDAEAQIDMSPLIDCVFILLIFFIVTTSFVEERGIEVDKPQPSSSSDTDSNADPVLFLVRADRKVTQDGKEISIGAIQPTVRRAVQKDPKTPVIVQVEKNADSGLMVRVIDEAKLAGAEKVNIANQ